MGVWKPAVWKPWRPEDGCLETRREDGCLEACMMITAFHGCSVAAPTVARIVPASHNKNRMRFPGSPGNSRHLSPMPGFSNVPARPPHFLPTYGEINVLRYSWIIELFAGSNKERSA
jgi:hypothetical protein